MMSIRRPAAADQARLLGNQFNMLAVANPARCRQRRVRFCLQQWLRAAFASIRTRSRRSSFVRHRLPSAASVTILASLAWKACSTRSASAADSVFLAASTRCAQFAASSAELRSFSSAVSWSRKEAEACGSSVGLRGFEAAFARRSPENC